LVVLAAIQLLIIATVPSKAPNKASSQNVASGSGLGGEGNGTVETGGGAAGAAGLAGGATGASGAGAIGGGATGAGGAKGGAGAIPAGAIGDTTHCISGREFDAKLAYFAPPCVPGTPGGPYPNNGGATSTGVTGDTITVVDYITNYGAEVNQILKAEGLLETYDDAVKLDAAWTTFINQHFVLYGRKIKIIPYQGQCQSVPPQYDCLIPEMDKLASQYHPFAVAWLGNTVCSACYAELAKDGVVAMGGEGFSDQLANENEPYVYSHLESATRIEQMFAEFYCKQLAGRPVAFAGTGNPAQNFNGKPRVLGVLSTNDPDNEATVKKVLLPALAKCGVSVNHFYYYDQNINTAPQQVAAGISNMDTTTNPATTVLCLCDAVAPAFVYEGAKANNYYPENVLADVQEMGLDSSAQSYESGLGCPGGGQCEFDNAFGLIMNGPQLPQNDDEGVRMYHAGGGQGSPPTTGITTSNLARGWVMLGALFENTGPALTPANMQARAPAIPAIGGGSTNQPLLKLNPHDWNWEQDAQLVYWSRNRTSPYNGQPGTFVAMEGSRFNLGEFPTLPPGQQPPIPAVRN
jgi:hypothetical protein